MEFRRKVVLTSTFIASTLIFTALASYRPGDSSHVVSVANPEGGKAMHGAHFSYGKERCSVLVTSNVKLDRKEDLKISVEGKNTPPYQILVKNPSAIDIGIRHWPRIKGNTIYGVQNDKIAFYVIFKPPEKDPICDMWVESPESDIMTEFDGKVYHFCSMDCRELFNAEPAKFAARILPAVKCNIVLTDSQGRRVLSVPVDISDPRAKGGGKPANAGKPADPACHDGAEASSSGRPSGSKPYSRGGSDK
ncbi:MAG TPA: hypothetical protein DET40_15245 [Lentisphaeria bacterium]|nr:MAG: hypothetical protein A2X45_05215 [Lentisphaerae bacterium GWF2_50_93]HCE44895.1 hypothetical protein [Lentisphaeria bacterium]